MRNALERKLSDALFELKLRARNGSMVDIQRMFGVILGLRIALFELNALAGTPRYDFMYADEVEQLIRDEFGQMKLKEIKNYAFYKGVLK
jgi:hypothetical protein